MKLQFHLAAQAEHLQHVSEYEAIRPGLGARYLADFRLTAARICEAPHRFRVVLPPDVRMTSLTAFPFFVFYRERDGAVQIVALSHFRRRPGYWATRL